MKTKKILLVCVLFAFVLGSCTTQKLAQQSDQNDDVYTSMAKAKEIPVYVVPERAAQKERSYVTEEQLYGDGYDRYANYSDYSDYEYASRIYRFHSNSPWRTYYYDGFYNAYSPYRFNSYGSSFNIRFGLGSPNWYYNDYLWGHSSFYMHNLWNPYNPYSYYGYNPYSPYYGGSYYYGGVGNGYPNGNNPVYTNPNYRARPDRGYDNVDNSGRGTINPGTSSPPSRTERYNGDQNPQPPARPRPNSTEPSSTAPAPEKKESERPSRTERYTPPPSKAQPTYTPPPSNDSGSRSGDSNSGGSSSGSRPSRSGR